MKNAKRSLANVMVYILKMLMYACLLLSFVGIMGINNKVLWIPSRTMVITWGTFVLIELLMVAIYGKYDIGRRKNKPIIYSMVLATMLTDMIAYLALTIMNTISLDMEKFRFISLFELIVVIFIHIIIVFIFVYIGNFLYFKIVPPERCCIITTKDADLEKVSRAIKKYRMQYKVKRVVDYRRTDLEDIIRKMDTVFLHEVPIAERTDIINYCYENMINIYISPDVADVVVNVAEHYLLDDVSMLNFNTSGLSLEQRFFKRTFDIVVSAVALLISSPFLLIGAIAIKMDDGGPIFFKQKRATRDGRVFYVYKFRTMRVNAGNRSASANDDRITKVGKILRRTRLDELPQFINIFLGDMSMVGPRPEMLENVYSYTADLPEFKYRLRVKGGLTGYAQIAGKYNTSPKDKLILDMMYIEKYSFWRDIKLCFQTLIVLLKSDSTEGFQGTKNVFVVEETPENVKKR